MGSDADQPASEFVSLAAVDAEMATRLLRRFVAAIISELDEDEQKFLASIDEPAIEVSLGEPKEIRVPPFRYRVDN